MADATNFIFALSMKNRINRPQYITVGFENNNVNEKTHEATLFNIMNVTECFCMIGSEF